MTETATALIVGAGSGLSAALARAFAREGLGVALAARDTAEVEQSLMVTCFGGFLVGQQAARAMLPRGRGTILFTGASASVKGYAQSAPFAMGKFGLRGLAQ